MTLLEYFSANPDDKAGFIALGGKGSESVSEKLYDNLKKASSNKSSPRYSESIKNSLPSGEGLSKELNENSGILGKLAGFASDVTRFVAKGAKGAIATQYGDDEKTDSAGKLMGVLGEGGLNPLKLMTSGLPLVLDEINQQLTNESKLFTEINSKVGISGELSKGLQKDMLQASIEGERYQISLQEIGQLYTQMSADSGKFSLISRGIMEATLPVSKVLGKSMQEMGSIITQYESVGLGADKTIKALDTAATRTVGLGLNARRVTEEMTKSIGNLNSYGFQNGVQGLERMSQKAVEFRMNMSEVFKLADNVFTPEKAVDLSASLQVLGGAMGDFNDPIKLMYMATNNVEGLQDALIGATEGLATYNQEQGRFEITGLNLRKAQEMAKALGVDYKELTNSAIAGAERMSATNALMGKSFINDKDKEFLINMSRMEGGEMKIVIPESLKEKFGDVTEISLDKIDKNQADALSKYQKEIEKSSSKELALSQLTETQNMVRSLDVLARYAIIEAGQGLKGGANAVFKNQLEKFQGAVDNYNKGTSTIYKTEENSKNLVNGVINDIKSIPSKVANVIKEGYNKVTGNESTTQPTTQKVEMVHTFNPTNPVEDGLQKAISRDNSLLESWTSKSKNDLTTPQVAHKN
jgi:hypothetical protein